MQKRPDASARWSVFAAVVVAWAGSAGWAAEPAAAPTAVSEVVITGLHCEYLENPAGLDETRPRLGWVLKSSRRAEVQSAFRILVASTQALLNANTGDLWDSGQVALDASAQVEYAGAPLTSRQACHWKVRVWDGQGQASAWSAPAQWSMGLLDANDWSAQWIGRPLPAGESEVEPPSPWLRKTFTLEAAPLMATAYVAALGYYELYVNGQRVGEDILSPAPSDFTERAYYVTHDITRALHPGRNCVAVWLGRGWYARGFPGVVHPGPLARVQVEARLAGGGECRVASDGTWKACASPHRTLDTWRFGHLGGEEYDARKWVAGWCQADFDEASWQNAVAVEVPTPRVSALMVQPNRIAETLVPVQIEEPTPGEYWIDFGRHLTGWLDIEVYGVPDKPIEFTYVEQRKSNGEIVAYHQVDRYIPARNTREHFQNRFNYHGFRWVKVTGLARAPQPTDAKAYLIHTGYPFCGEFACSNELLTRIFEACAYTYRCLSMSGYAVDCPHRERLGYGGDGQVTDKVGLYAFNLGAFYTKWLANWRDAQDPATGEIPNTAPHYYEAGGGPAYGAISAEVPWDLYRHYGDTRALQACYPMMRAYLRYLDSKTKDGLLAPFGDPNYGFIGDWVAPGHDQDFGPWADETSRTFFNNCYYAYVAARIADIADILGRAEDAQALREKAAAIRAAAHARFFHAQSNTYAEGSQPYLAFPLLIDMVPPQTRDAVMANLDREIRVVHEGHIDAGMHGTMFLVRYLNNIRRDDLIFEMVNQRTYPSWGYMLEQGANTIWERWDGEMSHMHSTLIAVGEWLPLGVGGIRPDESQPGFKRVIIDPRPVGDITWATTRYRTIRGEVRSAWRIEQGLFHIEVAVPANARALLLLPTPAPERITESGLPAAEARGVCSVRAANGAGENIPAPAPGAIIEIGSGTYAFDAPTS